MSLDTQARAGCLIEHVSRARSSRLPHEIFDRAVALAVQSTAHKTICAFFANTVTVRAIKHWRKGRANAPAWARDLLKKELAAQIEERRALIEGL
jgi:ABC-type cobalamin transport system permease subunit